jgi:ketosteroid isomerase-like protein
MVLQRRVFDAVRRGRKDEFLALCHAEAEVVPDALGGRVVRGEAGLRRWWAEREHAIAYDVSVHGCRVLGRRVALVEGRIRVMREGALFDRAARWVLISRDGLVWRYVAVRDVDDAYHVAGSLGALDEVEHQSPAWRETPCTGVSASAGDDPLADLLAALAAARADSVEARVPAGRDTLADVIAAALEEARPRPVGIIAEDGC